VLASAGTGSTSMVMNSVATGLAGEQLMTTSGQGAASLRQPSARGASVVKSLDLAATA